MPLQEPGRLVALGFLTILVLLMVVLGIFLLMASGCRTLVVPMGARFLEAIRLGVLRLLVALHLLVALRLLVARDRLVLLDLRVHLDRLVAVVAVVLTGEELAFFVHALSFHKV